MPGIGIGGVLNQESRLIAFSNVNLNEAKQCYDVYIWEFYVVVQFGVAIYHPRSIFYLCHQFLNFINYQKKVGTDTSSGLNLFKYKLSCSNTILV